MRGSFSLLRSTHIKKRIWRLNAESIDVAQRPYQLVRSANDAGGKADARVQDVIMQHLKTKRVECASRNVRGVIILLESLEHFGGRLIREREGKNALKFDAIFDEVEDLLRYHPGFTRTRTGNNKLNAIFFDSFLLRRVEQHAKHVERKDADLKTLCFKRVNQTPDTFSKSDAKHQKQPPARVATFKLVCSSFIGLFTSCFFASVLTPAQREYREK